MLAAAMAAPGILWAAPLLRGMGAEPGVLAHSVPYTRIMLGSAPSILLLFLMNAIFRGAGDAAIAMRVLWGANLLNMMLDPLLIYGLGRFEGFGVEGAAIATAISRTFGVALQLAVFARGSGRVKVLRRHFRPDFGILRRLSRISATGMLQFLIAHASWVALVWVIARSGSVAVAGYTIAIRIIVFSILPSWGLANAAATLVGQSLGARAPERAEAAVWRTGLCNAIFLGAAGLLFIAAAESLIGLFTHDAGVVAIGADCLRIFSYGYVFYAYGMVVVQAFNGAGDTVTPTLINLACYWGVQLPLAWMLALHMGWGARGAFWAVPVADGLLTAVGIVVFRAGRWKRREI
jgi:putative MATE family efflux protein